VLVKNGKCSANGAFVKVHPTNNTIAAVRLVTKEVTEAYIPDVNEEVTKQVPITIVDEQSYWYVDS